MNLKNKKILITGGSGSLGRQLIKELLGRKAENIVSVSRDEGLIKEAEAEINDRRVVWRVGNIADTESVKYLLKGIDFVYHTAAIKHVSLAEKYPREVLRINIFGILNLLEQSQNVSRFINISSDKAIGVVNCYGASKLLGEYLVSETNNFFEGKFINVRCPNFLGSRGSVLDLWQRQIKKQNKIEITDPKMTRFFITLPDAAKFIVDKSLEDNLNPAKIYYPLEFTKKFHLDDLGKAFIEVFGDKKTEIKVIGAKTGEKTHEDYLTDVAFLSVKELVRLLRNLFS